MKRLGALLMAAAVAVTTLTAPAVTANAGALYNSDDGYSDPMLVGVHDKVVVVDPGHGGKYQTGTASGGLVERDLNLKIGKFLKQRLQSYGVKVLLSRTKDADISLDNRTKYAAVVGSDFFASAHLNGATPSAHGADVFIANSNYDKHCHDVGYNVAKKIAEHLKKDLGQGSHGKDVIETRNSANGSKYPNGSKSDYYAVIRTSKLRHIPGIIMEPCFLTNKNERNKYLTSDKKLQALANAEADGIAEGLGFNLKLKAPEKTKLKSAKATGKAFDVKVTWKKAKNAERYIVFRKTAKGSWGQIGTTTKKSFTDKRAKCNTTYYYTVIGENANGRAQSYDNKGIKIKTPKHNVSIVSAVEQEDGTAKITWKSDGDVDGYEIYRSEDGGDEFEQIDKVKGNKTSYTDEDIDEDIQYTYTIRSYRKCPKYTYTDRNQEGGKSYLNKNRKNSYTHTVKKVTIKSNYGKSVAELVSGQASGDAAETDNTGIDNGGTDNTDTTVTE